MQVAIVCAGFTQSEADQQAQQAAQETAQEPVPQEPEAEPATKEAHDSADAPFRGGRKEYRERLAEISRRLAQPGDARLYE